MTLSTRLRVSGTSSLERFRRLTASAATRPTGRCRTGKRCTRARPRGVRAAVGSVPFVARDRHTTKEKAMSISMREVIFGAALGVFALNAHAMGDDTKKADKAQYKSTVAAAEAEYKSAKSACDAKSGNDKDVCIKEAKANLEKAKQDAKANRKSKDAMASASHEKMEANYSVAKEKCDALSGDAKTKCIDDAKARYHQ